VNLGLLEFCFGMNSSRQLHSIRKEFLKSAEGTNTPIISFGFCTVKQANSPDNPAIYCLERRTDGETERVFRLLQVEVRRERCRRLQKAEVARPARREHAARDRAGRYDGRVKGKRIVRVVNPERLLHDGQQHL